MEEAAAHFVALEVAWSESFVPVELMSAKEVQVVAENLIMFINFINNVDKSNKPLFVASVALRSLLGVAVVVERCDALVFLSLRFDSGV